MYVKFHTHGDRTVVAICDKELIGKKLKDKNISIEITERFYKGELKSEQEVCKIFQEATNMNIIGKKAIELALKQGIIAKDSIKTIKNIPHAQIYELA